MVQLPTLVNPISTETRVHSRVTRITKTLLYKGKYLPLNTSCI